MALNFFLFFSSACSSLEDEFLFCELDELEDTQMEEAEHLDNRKREMGAKLALRLIDAVSSEKLVDLSGMFYFVSFDQSRFFYFIINNI